ncbi:MAG: GNAT family N-acetyltransferase [Rhizomicrobium sp.]
MTLTIRPARPDEAEALSALCKRAKAHWGYDAQFMRLSDAALTIAPALIETGRVLVAEDDGGGLAGMTSLAPLHGDVWDLLHMFVEPAAIGTGAGRLLFGAIAKKARGFGGTVLSIQSDPHAEGFYLRLGARRCGEAPSESVPGRMLPMLEYDLRRD